MGLDDEVSDLQMFDTILEKYYPLLEYYSDNPDEKTLEAWETTNYYTGYSLLFHMLYPIAWVLAQGARPHDIKEEEIKDTKKYVRKRILKYYNKP
jgi:hypothetical protein